MDETNISNSSNDEFDIDLFNSACLFEDTEVAPVDYLDSQELIKEFLNQVNATLELPSRIYFSPEEVSLVLGRPELLFYKERITKFAVSLQEDASKVTIYPKDEYLGRFSIYIRADGVIQGPRLPMKEFIFESSFLDSRLKIQYNDEV